MRAAAIVGPGNFQKYRERFERVGGAQWTVGVPDESNPPDVVVVFGGDGTVHRRLSTLVTLRLPALIVPCGSGNDFARALDLRSVGHSLKAWCLFLRQGNNVRTVDLGLISESISSRVDAGGASAARKHPPHERYFCCVAGVGLDAEIARRANNLPKWVRAHGGYALSAPREFLRFAPFPMKISTNGSVVGPFQPTTLAAVANTPTYGGGMKIAPLAELDDGKLDLCIVREIDTFKLFCLFPTVYFGRHLSFKEVEYQETQGVKIETEHPRDVYADGEYVCQTPVEFRVARNALRVIVPE
jgi:diacylglycerol kinase (ATP)